MDFNLEHLRSFIVVARTGNLSAAAKELSTTQPNLGRQMAALEKEIGTELFARHSRGINLTRKGEDFLNLCNDIVGRLAQGTQLIRESDREPEGLLRIVTGIGTTEAIIANLSVFSEKYPKIQFCFSSNTDIFRFQIGDADIGFFPTQFSDPDLIQHHFTDMTVRIYCAPSYLQSIPTPKSLEDIQHHKLIVYATDNHEPVPSLNIHLLNSPSKHQIKNHYIEVNNIIALRAALYTGLGISTYLYSKEAIEKKLLVDVFPDMPDHKVPYYFTYHRRLEGSPKISAFYDFMKEVIKPWVKS